MPTPPFIANDTPQEGNLSKILDWREAVAILMERAWLGALVFVVVFLFFTFQARRQTPIYRSTATLLVEAQIPRLLNYQDVMAFNLRSLEYFNTHLNALHSRTMLERALDRSGLAVHPGFFPEIESREGKIAAARRLVSVIPIEKSRMIRISVEHPDPVIASDLANAMARAYIQQDLDNRMGTTMEAVEWLRARAEEYRVDLEAGLLQLQQYREETGSVSLEDDQNIVIAKLKALNTRLTDAQTERIQAETEWTSIQAQVDKGVRLEKIAPLLGDPGLLEMRRKLQDQQREVARLQQRYRAQHPDLQQAVELEQKLQGQFDEAGRNAVATLRSRVDMLRDQERNLLSALQEQEQEAFDLDRKLVRYNELKRNVEADQSIHQAVIARMRETSMSESTPSEVIRLAEEAAPGRAPVRPDLRREMIRGVVFGLVFGLGAIFLLYYADHRFRRNEEVERLLGIPVLATIPLIAGNTIADRGAVAAHKPAGEEAECFRTLRASLLLREDIRTSRVLMITSSGPGEGKSLVASNLAISLAQDGRRVLLVGCDLRRPVLDRIFTAESGHPGLSDVLKGRVAWGEALHRQALPNLDLLVSGDVPSQPAELLGNRAFADFLAESRDSYDHVIVDAPPVLGVSDALVLLPNVDGVLFVVRYGVTHSLGAKHAMGKMQAGGTPCLGCIMNGVNLRSLANYYYYRRYGGYAYQQYQAHRSPGGETASRSGS